MAKSLYVHIPFCHRICAYCDFAKVLYEERWAFSYVKEIEKEIAAIGINEPLNTVYVGGGTPSILPNQALKELLSFLKPLLGEGYEFTIEANPEDIDEEKLEIFRSCGVNRISIGIESSSPRLLALMGRNHTFEKAKEAVSLIKAASFAKISVDMIYALPNETEKEVKRDLSAFLDLGVNHISTYCLSVNPGTAFHNAGYAEMDEEMAGEQYELILETLRAAGYRRYEVSNFAKNGEYSKHNLVYWRDEEYYAAGLGASGYVDGVRFDNTRNLTKYLNGEHREKEERLSKESELEDYFLTNLRLDDGFSEETFEKRFGFSFLSKYRDKFEGLERKGLMIHKDGRFFCTDKGIEILDSVLLELF